MNLDIFKFKSSYRLQNKRLSGYKDFDKLKQRDKLVNYWEWKPFWEKFQVTWFYLKLLTWILLSHALGEYSNYPGDFIIRLFGDWGCFGWVSTQKEFEFAHISIPMFWWINKKHWQSGRYLYISAVPWK